MKTKCLKCSKSLTGRKDKRYCNANCRAAYHRAQNNHSVILAINKILIKNYKILTKLFEAKNLSEIRLARVTLASKGFNFDYCTRVYQNSKGKWYKYIYQYRWLEFSDQYVIIYKSK